MIKHTSLNSLNDNFINLYRVNYDSKDQTVNKLQYPITYASFLSNTY